MNVLNQKKVKTFNSEIGRRDSSKSADKNIVKPNNISSL